MYTNIKGNIVEAEVSFLLMKKGYSVFRPLGDGNNVDLIFLDTNNKAYKVQVKSSTKKNKYYLIDLRCSTGVKRARTKKYTNIDIDFFATTINGELYLIPINEVETKSTLSIRDKKYLS